MKKLLIISLLIGSVLSSPLFLLHLRHIQAFMGCETGFETWEGACAADRALEPYAILPLSQYLFFLVFGLIAFLPFLPGPILIVIVFFLFSLPLYVIVFLLGKVLSTIMQRNHG